MHHGQPLELVDKPIPQPVGTEVLVKVSAAGLCHTDLHIWEGGYDLGGGKRLNMSDRGIKPPITLSHEISGTVESQGPDAAGVEAQYRVKPGTPYLVHPWIGCGECAACLRCEENICAKPQALGVARPGGFADYVLVPHPRYLVAIDGMDAAQSAPLACAGVTTYSALNKFGKRIKEGPVVIIGAGGLGLMAIEVLKAMGGQGAIVVDIDPLKRQAALDAGALSVVDANARAVLDLVGATPTVTLAVACCGRGGHIVICGLMGGDITLSLPIIPMRPLNIQGSYVGTLEELRELVALVRKSGMKPIPVTRRPMSEANSALQDLHHGKVIGRTVLIP
jgi:D-arabinose 1-dehydrogenase-like Zn-dependent alcohol dehydrogenase